MDELQTHTNHTFHPFHLEDDRYSSSASSIKESMFSHAEVESSNTIIRPVMVIEVANIEHQLESMKATLDRLLQESTEMDVQIKRQNKQIANLIKKLEKRPIEASKKYSGAEESDNQCKAKKDHSLGSKSVEQIQSLIGNAVKGRGVQRSRTVLD